MNFSHILAGVCVGLMITANNLPEQILGAFSAIFCWTCAEIIHNRNR